MEAEMLTPSAFHSDASRDPRYICAQTIRAEEQNLAQVQVLRAKLALPATLGDRHSQKQAKVLDASEERIRRRLALARLALGQLEERDS